MWLKLDFLKRKLFLKNEFKKKILKYIIKNSSIPYLRRYQALYVMSSLKKSSSVTYLRNRCSVSGRVWSYDRKTSYTRFVLRQEIYKSSLPGFSRASW